MPVPLQSGFHQQSSIRGSHDLSVAMSKHERGVGRSRPLLSDQDQEETSFHEHILYTSRSNVDHVFRRLRDTSICRSIIVVSTILGVLLLAGFPALRWNSHPSTAAATLHDNIYNSTLGFGAILVKTLKPRTDRHDALALLESLSDIKISHVIDGVYPEDIVDKAKPFGEAKHNIGEKYMGSWRAHMNAMQYVVKNRIETALIFEDDVDWDIYIKPQMAAFARGLRESKLRDGTGTIDPARPYGTDWDMLHLGSSQVNLAPAPYDKLYSFYDDEYRASDPGCIEDLLHMWCWTETLEKLNAPDATRVIVPTYDSLGLTAVAVTLKGAQRLLYELSWWKLDSTLDLSINQLTRAGNLTSWSVLPPIYAMWKTGDPSDSDIGAQMFPSEHSNAEGAGIGLEFSARKELTKAYGPSGPSRWSKENWAALGLEL